MKFLLLCALLASLASNGLSYDLLRENHSNSITKSIKTGHLDITIKNNKIVLAIRKNDGAKLEAALYTKAATLPSNESFKIEQDCEKLTTCIQLANKTHAKIKANPENEVIYVSRQVEEPSGELVDCFALADDTEWFSGPEWRYQRWPLQHMYFEEETYLTSHPENMALAERYWLSSKGVYVKVDEKDPLFLDQNNFRDKNLCLVAKNKKPYQQRQTITLNYEIGVFGDPKLAHKHVVEKHFGKPTGRPSELMVTHPIWSTWARYKADVNEALVRELAGQIVKNGFKNSQIEIDDNWETCYGSAVFDTKKFPDVTKLVADLKTMNFRVTLWIHPFINEGCNDGEGYDYALGKGYFVKNEHGEVHTSWWQGKDAAVIDFTNAAAVAWWSGRLEKLRKLGIDSFKFDAGEESWLPGDRPQLSGPPELLPGIFSQNYTSALAARFGDSIEVRVGWGTQTLPVFVRMIDKDSRWTRNNGLPTLITTLLQMNLNGYVYVLPDMIGGNGYVDNALNSTKLPSKELFIRWLQASVFMPALQYSFVPWDYDAETIEISKKFTDLHAEYAPKIIELMKKAMENGNPINPPVWWVDPSNVKIHKINDEYMLGEEILVAPVIEEGATARDIYLPLGQWKDPRNGSIYAGPYFMSEYSAPLDYLPYFIKV